MACSRYRDLLSRYVDGEVTPRQRAEVLQHVENCRECAAWLARVRQADVLLKGVPSAGPSDRVRQAVLSSARTSQSTQPRTRQSAHPGSTLRLYAAEFLLRFDVSPQRVALLSGLTLLSLIGLAYYLNILPPPWGYNTKLGFTFSSDEQAAIVSTPLPAITHVSGEAGPVSVPKIVRMEPLPDLQAIEPNSAIGLLFDLPMDRKSVEEALRIDPPAAGALSWDVDNEVHFTPTGAGLLRGVTYTVALSDTARSIGGTRVGKPVKWQFRTRDPYGVSPGVAPGTTVPVTGSLTLAFDVAMDAEKTGKAISLASTDGASTVAASVTWDPEGKQATISSTGLLPESGVALRVGADARTAGGETLGRTSEYTYTVALPEPRLRILGGRLLTLKIGSPALVRYEALSAADMPLSGVRFALYKVPGEQFSALRAQAEGRAWPATLPAGLTAALPPAGIAHTRAANEVEGSPVGVERLSGLLPGGYLAVATGRSRTEELTDWQMLVVTDRVLELTARDSLWATDETGKAWAGAEISLYSPDGELLEKGVTDNAGLWLPGAVANASLALARDLDGHVAVIVNPQFKARTTTQAGSGTLAASLVTDKNAYYPGEVLNFRALIGAPGADLPPATPDADRPVLIQLVNPGGTIISSLALKPDRAGGMTGLFNLAPGLPAGEYNLRVSTGGAWRDFPTTVQAPVEDTLSLYAAPSPQQGATPGLPSYTVSVIGPNGSLAQGAILTATLGIAGDPWMSAPITATTNASGQATLTPALPDWAANYTDPGLYLNVQGTWQELAGSAHSPLNIATARTLSGGLLTAVSPLLNVAAIAEQQKDDSTRLRLVTLDTAGPGGDLLPSGDLLVEAESPAGELRAWSIDMAAAGGDVTLPLPAEYSAGHLSLYRSSVEGVRRVDLTPQQDGLFTLTHDAGPYMPGAPVTVSAQLTNKDGTGAAGTATLWFQRAGGDLPTVDRGWAPALSIDATGAATATLTAPQAPGLWWLMGTAATGNGEYTRAWDLVEVMPGPTIVLPPALHLKAQETRNISVWVHNPTSADFSSGMSASAGDRTTIGGSTLQRVDVPSGARLAVNWQVSATEAGDSSVGFSFPPGSGAGGAWTLPVRSEAGDTQAEYGAGSFDGQSVVGVEVPYGLPDNAVQLEIRASTSMLSALADAVGETAQGDEGQTAVWAARLSAAPSVLSAYNRADAGTPEIRVPAALERSLALQEIYAAQHADGGWGASTVASAEKAPSSIAATSDVLLALRRQNLAWAEVGGEPQPAVDSAIVARGLAYLAWGSGAPATATGTNLDSKARALYVLSLYGAANNETIRELLNQTSSEAGGRLTRAGQAWLALALWQTGSNDDAQAIVDRLLDDEMSKSGAEAAPMLEALMAASNVRPSDGNGNRESSPQRDNAKYRPGAAQYARALMEMRRGAIWSSPSLTADAFWTLSRYAAQEEKRIEGQPGVVLNDHPVLNSSQDTVPGTLSVVINGSALHSGTNSLKLQAPAGRTLYYSLSLRAAR